MRQSLVSAALLEELVCPLCHGKLELFRQGAAEKSGSRDAGAESGIQEWLHCLGCGRYYPIEDGLAVMRQERATTDPRG